MSTSPRVPNVTLNPSQGFSSATVAEPSRAPTPDRRRAERLLARDVDKPSPLHEKALRQYRRGDFADAAVSLTTVLRATPNHATAWSDLGVIHAAMGRFDLALGCYDKALAIKADHAAAIGNKGVALCALRRPGEALGCYDRVLALNPKNAENHNNRGAALRELGRSEEALASFGRALALKPKLVDALSNRGNALVELGRLSEALASFDKALRLDRKRADLLINRGVALARLGQTREALQSYDKALALNPNSAEAHNNRGEALRGLGRDPEAAEAILRALALNPNYPEAINNLGNMFLDIKRPAEALTAYDAALGLRPHFAPALGNRAQALLDLERPIEAIAASDRMLALDPGDYAAHNARGGALSALGREAEALANFDAAIAVRPDSEIARNNKGLALIQCGRIGEGVAALEEALERAPRNARAHYNLALVKTFESGDPEIAALGKLVAPNSTLDAGGRVTAHFALAKALADIGDFDLAFSHLSSGNAGKRATIAYDESGALGRMERAREAYTAEVLRDDRRRGDPSPLPVFIVGMPRSGTSLVEQILASHPLVHGAGEISDFEQAALAIGGAVGEAVTRPEAIRTTTFDQLARLGADYVERIRAANVGAPRIVNKMPGNFVLAGLIALALPNARIIHVVRDPRDTCLSCFATLFTRNVPYAYDLGELGRFHRAYQSLMAGWRDVLPRGMLIDIRYEDVVVDLETQARRLVAHCGLQWDSECLEFHTNARSVRTASLAQVRRPVYRSSVGRWRAYERHLGPLLQALEPNETGSHVRVSDEKLSA